MEHIINKVDRESLKPGDHIYAFRKLHSHSHHGIFNGDDRVIHYNVTREGNTSRRGRPCKNCGVDQSHLRGVVKTCLDCFLRRHSLRRFQYGVDYIRYLGSWPGICTTGLAHPLEVSTSHAIELFNNKKDGFGDYALFENNCEAFAVFCKTGKRVTDQARKIRLLISASVKYMMDRLLGDVLVHHGEEKHSMLEQRMDIWLGKMLPLKKVIADLEKEKEITGA